jgi:hypothetical protein
MRTCHLKKFHEVIFGRPCLLLEVVYGSCHVLLTGVTGFHIAVAIACHYCNVMGSALLSLLAALSAFPGTFDGGLGGCGMLVYSRSDELVVSRTQSRCV